MAKPIEATPILEDKDAIRFIKDMLKEEKNPSSIRLKTIKKALEENFTVKV